MNSVHRYEPGSRARWSALQRRSSALESAIKKEAGRSNPDIMAIQLMKRRQQALQEMMSDILPQRAA